MSGPSGQAATAGIAFTAAGQRVRLLRGPGPRCSGSATGSTPADDRRLAAQVAGSAAAPVHRRGPGGRLPLRHLDPAGRVLPDPGAGPAAVRPGVLRGGHPGQPRPRPARPGRAGLRPADHPQGPPPDPGRFRTRVLTDGVTPSLHVDYKHSKIKQYHKEDRALRTETTINDSRDFGIGKRLCNLPALRQVGFPANRRLLDVERLSHDPTLGDDAFARRHRPGRRRHPTRVRPALRRPPAPRPCSPPWSSSGCCPTGSATRDLRAHLAPLLGLTPADMTPGRMTYDLRRLRLHGLIERIPGTHRYPSPTTACASRSSSPAPTTDSSAPASPNSSTITAHQPRCDGDSTSSTPPSRRTPCGRT